MKAILVAMPAMCFVLLGACVGDEPSVAGAGSTPDGGGEGATPTQDSGGGSEADAATDGGGDSGRLAKGDFVWALTAARGPGDVADGLVGIGAADQIAGATSVGANTTFGDKQTTGAGAALFRTDAAKKVAFAARIAPPSGGSVVIQSTATDSFGDVYVVGSFTASTLTLGATNLQVTGTGGADFFAKFSGADGSVLWARSVQPTGYSVAKAVATRGTDVAVVFEFGGNGGSGAVTYDRKDGGTTTPVTVTAEGGSPDGLVLFLEGSTGKALWGKHVHGPATDRLESIRIDTPGNVFVGGATASATLKIDASPTAVLVKAGDAGAASPVILRFDAADPHTVGFARSFGIGTAAKSGTVKALATASNGDVLVCGSFEASIDFGMGVVNAKGLRDGFLARVPTVGASASWTRLFGGAQDDDCTSVEVDATDQVAVGLSYSSSGVMIDTHALPAPFAGKRAGAVAKLSGAGAFLWGHEVVGKGGSVHGVAIHPSGDVLFSGSFLGTVNLGGGDVPSGNGGAEPTYFLVRRGY